jgi:hypothetical protein
LADLSSWGDLFQIAAPADIGIVAKQEIGMTNIDSEYCSRNKQKEAIICSSGGYVETFRLRCIEANKDLTELLIESQFQHSKNPLERRIRVRSCITRQELLNIKSAINDYLSVL